LVWGAVWLYRATGNKTNLNTAEQLYKELDLLYMDTGFTWDAKVSGVEVSRDRSPTNESFQQYRSVDPCVVLMNKMSVNFNLFT
jgi:hypothetical protein